MPSSINQSFDTESGLSTVATYVWDAGTSTWVKATQAGGAGGGGLTDAELRATPVAVSGPVTDAQLRATAVPVSGTFWQSTQPVSGPLTDAQLRATAVPTKDSKDTGRTYVVITIDRVAGVTTEALATMTINKGGTTSSGTSYTVTSGKTLRLQTLFVNILPSSTTGIHGRVRVRSAATVSATSPIVMAVDKGFAPGTQAAGTGGEGGPSITVPDGLEIAAGQQIGISQVVSATTSTVSVCLIGYEY